MIKILSTLAVAGAAALGLAPKADAAPTSVVNVPVAAHGSVGVGIGFGTGGYYAPAPVASGYWATQYRTVPTTVFLGYDAQGRPMYETRYVQEAYQVWVPTTYYATSYYARPTVSFGIGLGFGGHRHRRWR